MSPEVGSNVIAIALSLIGSHYINGGYGACPDREDGCPCRIGSVKLIADPNRLNPAQVEVKNKNLAVFAAEMSFQKENGTKVYCVCAGNYATAGGQGDCAERPGPCRLPRRAEGHARRVATFLPLLAAARVWPGAPAVASAASSSGASPARATATSTASASSATVAGRRPARSCKTRSRAAHAELLPAPSTISPPAPGPPA